MQVRVLPTTPNLKTCSPRPGPQPTNGHHTSSWTRRGEQHNHNRRCTIATSRTGTTKWLNLTKQAKTQALEAGQYTCPLCGVALDWTRSRQPNSPEADHITPHAEGGTDTIENTRVICRLCNQKLGGKLGATRTHKPRATDRVTPKTFPTTTTW